MTYIIVPYSFQEEQLNLDYYSKRGRVVLIRHLCFTLGNIGTNIKLI